MEVEKIADEAVKELGKAAAKEVWEKKSRLFGLLERSWSFLRGRPAPDQLTGEAPSKSPRGILILGPGGTGKTTLARVLSGDVNVLIDPPGFYQPSVAVESVRLLGAPEVELVVVPGQTYRHRHQGDFTQLSAEIVRGAYRGLILVADYGYHAIESEWARDHPLHKGKGKQREFLPTLLAAQQKEEIDLLDKLAPILKAVSQRIWLLVVVLKQDLWSPQQDEVIRHYRDGAWGIKMSEIANAIDPRLFYLRETYASLHIQNYTTRGGRETLKKNAAGYDATRQRQSLEELFQVFDALREWEDQR